MKRCGFFFAAIMLLANLYAADLTIELKIGTAIEDRNVVGENAVFPVNTQQLVGWSRIKGAKEPLEVFHRWKHKNNVHSLVELPIRSSNYRAWSYIEPLGKKGAWTLEVLDWEKNVLATTSFELR